ncbi:MAG: hypothetical protein ACFB0B_10825 [Thermonemataceae bacterium]
MKHFLVKCLYVFSFVSLPAYVWAQDSTITWQSLKQENFSIDYPSNWRVDQSGNMNTSLLLFSPLNSSSDAFSENINLMVQAVPDDATLEAFVASAEESLKATIVDCTILSSETVGKGIDAYQVMHFEGKFGKFLLHWEQHSRVKNGAAYVLTFTAEQTEVKSYSAVSEQILTSFKVN